MINLYRIEARSLNILGLASHNYWVLTNGEGRVIAELHGLATDRISGEPETIGVINDSLRAWSFASTGHAREIGIPTPVLEYSGYIKRDQKALAVFFGSADDVFARWRHAVSAIDMINRLDLDYPAFGVNIVRETVNSNSMFRTFGELMSVPFGDFPGVIEPGVDNLVIPKGVIDALKYTPGSSRTAANQLIDAEKELARSHENGQITQSLFERITTWFSDIFSGVLDFFGFGSSSQQPSTPDSGSNRNPLGAFYDFQSPASDAAASIADKTFVLFDHAQTRVSTEQLAGRDINADGLLSGEEVNNLYAWADGNENGLVDADEMKSLAHLGIERINAGDMRF